MTAEYNMIKMCIQTHLSNITPLTMLVLEYLKPDVTVYTLIDCDGKTTNLLSVQSFTGLPVLSVLASSVCIENAGPFHSDFVTHFNMVRQYEVHHVFISMNHGAGAFRQMLCERFRKQSIPATVQIVDITPRTLSNGKTLLGTAELVSAEYYLAYLIFQQTRKLFTVE